MRSMRVTMRVFVAAAASVASARILGMAPATT